MLYLEEHREVGHNVESAAQLAKEHDCYASAAIVRIHIKN